MIIDRQDHISETSGAKDQFDLEGSATPYTDEEVIRITGVIIGERAF